MKNQLKRHLLPFAGSLSVKDRWLLCTERREYTIISPESFWTAQCRSVWRREAGTRHQRSYWEHPLRRRSIRTWSCERRFSSSQHWRWRRSSCSCRHRCWGVSSPPDHHLGLTINPQCLWNTNFKEGRLLTSHCPCRYWWKHQAC